MKFNGTMERETYSHETRDRTTTATVMAESFLLTLLCSGYLDQPPVKTNNCSCHYQAGKR